MACAVCEFNCTTVLCDVCVGRLRRDLAEVESVVDDLNITLTRQAKTRPTGNGSSEPPMPYSIAASEAHTRLRLTLKEIVGWSLERLADQGVRAQPPMPAKAVILASWLYARLDWLVTQPEAGDAYAQITTAVNDARRATDSAPDTFPLGACGNTVEGITCTEELRGIDGRPEATCRTCGAVWDVAQRRDHQLGAAWAWKVTAVQGSRLFPITPAQVRGWAARGYLDPAEIVDGTPYYAVPHLHRLWQLRRTGTKLTNIKETAA
jgi:hypothetical protein